MWYDSYSGINRSLKSLKTFRELLNERWSAGYNRKERMNNWCVLGYYYLDSCGNVGQAIGFDAHFQIENFPLVLSTDDFYKKVHAWEKTKIPDVLSQEEIQSKDFDFGKNTRPYPMSISFGMKDTVPDIRIRCPYCKEGWTIENVKDVVGRQDDFEFDLLDFENKTIGELKSFFRNQSYYMQCYEFYEDYKDDNEKIKDRLLELHKQISIHRTFYYHKECLKRATEEKCNEFRIKKGEGYKQSNLAGCIDCDAYIQLELDLAGVPVIIAPKGNSEVPYTKHGELKIGEHVFIFHRAWYYWIVVGRIHLDIAKKLYATELGQKSVRVAGHCGCPPPEQWVDEEGYINTYHIDSWQGLKFFVDTLKEYL
jgi:hypothetical protein